MTVRSEGPRAETNDEGLGKRNLIEKKDKANVMPIPGRWIPLIVHQVVEVGLHSFIHGGFHRDQKKEKVIPKG